MSHKDTIQQFHGLTVYEKKELPKHTVVYSKENSDLVDNL